MTFEQWFYQMEGYEKVIAIIGFIAVVMIVGEILVEIIKAIRGK